MRDISAEMDQRSLAVLDLMDELEYRRIVSAEDLEAVGKLRTKSYNSFGIMDRDGPIIDALDRHSHARVFALYYRGTMISTIRLHHVVAAHRLGTSYDIFPDVLDPLLDQGMSFIDTVRHASDPDVIGELPMPFLNTRLVAMACHYFGADYTLAAVKRAHWAFYRRAFGATQLADARQGRDFAVPFGLFASSYDTMYERVTQRFPFFRSLEKEQELLFAPVETLGTVPLTVRPTARLAIAARAVSTAAA